MPLSAPARGSILRLFFDFAPSAALSLLAVGVYSWGALMLDRTLVAEQQQRILADDKRSCVADLTQAFADGDFTEFRRRFHAAEKLPARLQELAKRVAVDGFLPPLEVKLSPPRRHAVEALASQLELTAKLRHEGHFYTFVDNIDDWAAGAYWFEDCALKPVAGQDFSVLARCRLRLLSRSR